MAGQVPLGCGDWACGSLAVLSTPPPQADLRQALHPVLSFAPGRNFGPWGSPKLPPVFRKKGRLWVVQMLLTYDGVISQIPFIC